MDIIIEYLLVFMIRYSSIIKCQQKSLAKFSSFFTAKDIDFIHF